MKKSIIIFTVILFSTLLMGSKKPTVWVAGWQTANSLNAPRSGAAVVAESGFIYVIGGVNNNASLKTTEYAKVNDDGSLGKWQKGPDLNEARGHTNAAFHNGYIYVVGGAQGKNGGILLRTAERSKILPKGGLGPWVSEKTTMNMPRRCSKVVISNGHIFAIGGFGGDLLNTVDHAKIKENGELDEWFEEDGKLIKRRYISGVKKAGDKTYVVGGHHPMEGDGIRDVEWSEVNSDDGFEEWKSASPLQIGRYGLNSAVHKNNMYALGGITSKGYLDSTEMTSIGHGGELLPWSFTTPLSFRRATFAAVVYKDNVYVIGGASKRGFFNTVEYATFNEAGDIGYMGTKEDADAVAKLRKEEDDKIKETMPNKGIVKKVMHTSIFTYLQVEENGLTKWLSVPRVEVNVGTTIRYGNGMLMSNFESKQLQVRFSNVLMITKGIKIIER